MLLGGTPRIWAAMPFVALAFLCAPAHSSAAAAGLGADGKYCIDHDSTMLLTRPGANDSLEFGMSSWNARAHYFSVFGLAQPEAGGWRFRQNMNAADPEQRCEALIARLPNGGYSFAVTQAGGCVADGGYGASPQPGQKILFPAGSRQGAVPPGKPMAEAMTLERGGVTCQKPQQGRQAHALPDQSATATPAIHCPATFEGKKFLWVDLYDGPKSRMFSVQPYQGDAANDADAKQSLAGWDRWNLDPSEHSAPDIHYSILILYYNNLHHVLWTDHNFKTDIAKTIVLPSYVTQCYQYRRADETSMGITCTGGVPPIMRTPSDKVLPPPLPEETPPSRNRP